jgi:hypothetical protein
VNLKKHSLFDSGADHVRPLKKRRALSHQLNLDVLDTPPRHREPQTEISKPAVFIDLTIDDSGDENGGEVTATDNRVWIDLTQDDDENSEEDEDNEIVQDDDNDSLLNTVRISSCMHAVVL